VRFSRNRTAAALFFTGAGLVGLGVLLLVVKIVMLLAAYAAVPMLAVGMILVIAGVLLARREAPDADDIEDPLRRL